MLEVSTCTLIVSSMFQDFMNSIENKKPIVLSLNLLSKAFPTQDSPEATKVIEQLNHMNNRFEALDTRTSDWMDRLRRALASGCGLLAAIRDLQLQSDSVDAKLRAIQPVNIDASKEVLGAQYNRLKALRGEVEMLLDYHAMLQEAAAHVEASGNAREAVVAKERLAELEDRFKVLQAATIGNMEQIEDCLGIQRDDSVSICIY